MKFCICFFGVIGRSIEYTIDSINENIFNVLKANNIEYDVFIHNMIVDKIYNPRAGEINSIINNENYKLLNPTEYIEDKQEDFDKNYNNWGILFNNGDEYNNKFNTLKNAIRELYSLKRVTSLWENKEKYDLYLYLRPDLLYETKLDIQIILKHIHTKNILFTPSWAQKHELTSRLEGLNDRIYFGDYDVMLKVAKRIDCIKELNRKIYIAENFLYRIVKKYDINTIHIDLSGSLIRADGLSQQRHLELDKENLRNLKLKNHKLLKKRYIPCIVAAAGIRRLFLLNNV